MDATRFESGDTFIRFLERPFSNVPLWQMIYKHATVSNELVERILALGGRWHLLALNEDWCGDSVNILPYVARLADGAHNLEFRILGRDANPDIMDEHLTRGSRSIPVIILYDENFIECGWWGPRPAELQRWVLEEGLQLPKPDRYKQVRTWYARDRGVTTMQELVTKLEVCMKSHGGRKE